LRPILFMLGDFPIGTYGLLVALGVMVGVLLARHLGKRDGLIPDAITDISLTVLLAGVLGAKLLMIVVDMIHGEPLARVFSLGTLRAGGAVHGGVILGLLAFFWRIRKLKLPLNATMDALTPAVALGQAIGRWGCFFAGCCYGSASRVPWAVTFMDPAAREFSGTPIGVALHPVQIYNSLANLAVMGILLLLGRKRRFKGQVAACYFFLEGIGRVITEFWRGDLDRGVWLPWLSTGRLTGFLFVIIGVILWTWFQQPQEAARA
jgi:phosphatidylglycerol---prolipoprotein diacylglyceryl transferase